MTSELVQQPVDFGAQRELGCQVLKPRTICSAKVQENLSGKGSGLPAAKKQGPGSGPAQAMLETRRLPGKAGLSL